MEDSSDQSYGNKSSKDHSISNYDNEDSGMIIYNEDVF